MAKFCSNCGKPINESDKHCSACGTKVNGVSSQDIATFVGEKVVGLGDKIVTDFIEPQEATVGVEVRKDQGFIDYFFRKDGRLNRKPYIIRLLAIEITKFIALFILWYLLSDIYGNLSMINSILFF